MIDNERYTQILNILEKKKKVTVNGLVKTLYVSPATVRRDLCEMAKRGLIKRVHGGAISYASTSQESSIIIRENANKQEKQMICSKALSFIKNSQSIFLDSSSTVSNLVDYLNERKFLTIITTGLTSASLLSSKTPFTIFIPGGFIHSQTNSIQGTSTLETIKNLHTDLFIFSCSGLSLRGEVTESNLEQSEVKKTMARNSSFKILLVDSSKIGKTYLSSSVALEDIDVIITDKKVDDKLKAIIVDNDVQLIECEK